MNHNTYPTQTDPDHLLPAGDSGHTHEQHMASDEPQPEQPYSPVQEAENILRDTNGGRFVGRAALRGTDEALATNPDGPDTAEPQDHRDEPVDRHISISNGVGHLQVREGDSVHAVTDPFGDALELTTAHEAYAANGYMYVDGKLLIRRAPDGRKLVLDDSGTTWLPAPGFLERRALERDGGRAIQPEQEVFESDETQEPAREAVQPVAPTIASHERESLSMEDKADRLLEAGVYAKPSAVAMELYHKPYEQLSEAEKTRVGMVTGIMINRQPRLSFRERMGRIFKRR